MDESVLRTLVIDFKREALKKGFRLTFSTIGTSMVPLIRSKDRIVVADCDVCGLKFGDIILFQRDASSDKIVAHRVVKRIKYGRTHSFITKGDSSLNCDRPVVLPDMILGKITEIQKPVFKISLDSLPGKILNMFMLMFSVSRIIYLGRLIWRRIKPGLKRKAHYCPPE